MKVKPSQSMNNNAPQEQKSLLLALGITAAAAAAAAVAVPKLGKKKRAVPPPAEQIKEAPTEPASAEPAVAAPPKKLPPRRAFILAAVAVFAIVIIALLGADGGMLDVWSPRAEAAHVYSFLGDEPPLSSFVGKAYNGVFGAKINPVSVVAIDDKLAQYTNSREFVSAEPLIDLDFKQAGQYTVPIGLRDARGNVAIVYSELSVIDGRRSYSVEAGTAAGEISVSNFIFDENAAKASFKTDISKLDLNVASADYKLELELEGQSFECTLRVRDTLAPLAKLAEGEFWITDEITPLSLFESVEDATEVSASFAEEYDFSRAGEYEVEVLLEDSAGNLSEIETTVQVIQDLTGPVISGAEDITIFLNNPISYRNGVTVSDNRDESLEFVVDSSAVNQYVAGRYPVIYSATDSAGNTTSITRYVLVLDADAETVYARADEVLDSICTPDMTQYEKAEAIHRWIRYNVRYVGSSVKSSVEQGAYDGLFTGKGDCFTFYSTSEVLLTRAGIENQRIERTQNSSSEHYWNLVNVGDGWYHFDTCPNTNGGTVFMYTDTQVEQVTRSIAAEGRKPDFYIYDKENYPEVVR